MNREAIIEELNLMDEQEEALLKRRRKYMRMLTEATAPPVKTNVISRQQMAEMLNQREKTLLKRTTCKRK